MGLYSGGLIIGRIFASEIWGAYFREGFFFGGGGGMGAYYRNFKVSIFVTRETLNNCLNNGSFLLKAAILAN